ncbi:DJ-1/PfpI family protein [Algimonas porphyrae]|uniref:AraC family transcriptional regulator n=1 Tax=Algimonas porphyrae TaxID=1128113 RepID=A0ABQ5V4B5_9PROT|nr:DJ-1/PfpI family protein [Algimonas porphyrae]GLQ21897.1 AraC family transcriptional regulator [Algimonas porphyrae]
MKQVGILIFDDVEELDFVGPWEVFQMVNEVARLRGETEPLHNRLISRDGADILAFKQMRVGAHASMAAIEALDVLLVPGGQGSRAVIQDEAMMGWVERIAPGCDWVTSVCTGAFILSKAGLLNGRRATTHWSAFSEFERLNMGGTLVPHVRYVRDEHVVTAAGVSAGIDMALWLVGQWFSPQMSRDVARAMQYDPVPPYAADV